MSIKQTKDEERIKEINAEIEEFKKSIINKKLIEHKEAKDFLNKIHKLIDEDPIGFRLTVCHWVLDYDDQSSCVITKVYKYLAELVRKRLEQCKQELKGYVTAKAWIESEVYIDRLLISTDYRDPYLQSILHEFFHPIAEDVGNQSAHFCYMVYFGVPLYLYDEKLEDYCLLDEKSELYSYLKLRGKYYDVSSGFSLPDWTEKLYIHTDHVEWFYKLDNDSSIPENEGDARAKLRTAYRNIIGLKENATSIDLNSSMPRLYKIMQEVITRYYGNQFDINDVDTWTRQTDILDWLKSEHNLSHREAVSIDIVTRPDKARNK